MSLFAKSPKPCKQTKLNIQRRDITTPIFISNHLKTCPHKKMPPWGIKHLDWRCAVFKQAVALFSKRPNIIFCEGIRGPKLANKLSLTAIRNIKALTWMLDLPKKTLFFHSVFSLRYCAALENTNCLRYRPDDSSAIPELTVAAGDTAVPELVADRRARALWTKVMITLIITFHTLVLAEEGGGEVRLSRRFSHGHNRRATNICRLACQTVTGWKNSATACSSHNTLAVQVPTVRSAMRVTMKRDKSSYLSLVLLSSTL